MAADHSVGAEIGLDGIAGSRLDRANEGARERGLPGLEREAEGAELVGEPGDGVRRMIEDAGGEGRQAFTAASSSKVGGERPKPSAKPVD
jgi:hypothetical protein